MVSNSTNLGNGYRAYTRAQGSVFQEHTEELVHKYIFLQQICLQTCKCAHYLKVQTVCYDDLKAPH